MCYYAFYQATEKSHKNVPWAALSAVFGIPGYVAFYTYDDCKTRGMNAALWPALAFLLALAALAPWLIFQIFYVIFRNPVKKPTITVESIKTRRAEELASGAADGLLSEQRGCFVTLTNAGRLRGCIGTFQPHAPLAEMIVEMARAATRDPRFTSNPIASAELPELSIEVSVLSPLRETDEPAELTVGVHGIYIVSGARAGCFLPEVATDLGWNAQEFLTHCCKGKAGLAGDAWKNPDTQVYLFTSEKFGQ